MASEKQEPVVEALPTGSVMGFPAHFGRPSALGEVHARPHPLLSQPRVLIQLSFMTEAGSAVDHGVLAELSRRLGIAAPDRQARHHSMKWGQGSLRWERHTEFSTYLWEGPLDETSRTAEDMPFGNGFSPPGTVISGSRLEIRKWTEENEKLIAGFDDSSLSYSLVENGKAAIATDFRQDGDGLTRILVLDRGMSPAANRRAGAAAARNRDLPHPRHARPAAGAVAVGARAPHRGPAGRHHPRDEDQASDATARNCCRN